MTTETQKVTPAVLAPGQQRCDRKSGDVPCAEVAAFRYVWDWGETGVCCAQHGAELQMLAPQLGRGLSLVPLENQPPPQLTRDERVQLHARALTFEAELEEAKARGAKLYASNTELSNRVQLLTMREAEALAQVKDRDAVIATLQQKLEEGEREAGNLVAELERTRTLLQFSESPEAAAARRERGLEPNPT